MFFYVYYPGSTKYSGMLCSDLTHTSIFHVSLGIGAQRHAHNNRTLDGQVILTTLLFEYIVISLSRGRCLIIYKVKIIYQQQIIY